MRRVLRPEPLAKRDTRYRSRMGSSSHAPTPRGPGWFDALPGITSPKCPTDRPARPSCPTDRPAGRTCSITSSRWTAPWRQPPPHQASCPLGAHGISRRRGCIDLDRCDRRRMLVTLVRPDQTPGPGPSSRRSLPSSSRMLSPAYAILAMPWNSPRPSVPAPSPSRCRWSSDPITSSASARDIGASAERWANDWRASTPPAIPQHRWPRPVFGRRTVSRAKSRSSRRNTWSDRCSAAAR